jgi:hypothetical protein
VVVGSLELDKHFIRNLNLTKIIKMNLNKIKLSDNELEAYKSALKQVGFDTTFSPFSFKGLTFKMSEMNLVKGDVFVVTGQEEVFVNNMFPEDIYRFILVKNQYGEIKKFYPHMVFKKVTVLGKSSDIELAQSKGSVFEFGKQYLTMQGFMDSIVGKQIKVTDERYYEQVKRDIHFRTRILDFDFV